MKAKLVYKEGNKEHIDDIIVHILRDKDGNKLLDDNGNDILVIIPSTSERISCTRPSVSKPTDG